MTGRVLIPASGTVRFIVWNYEDHADIPTMLHIEGDREWRRPVVGLVFQPENPATGESFNAYPVVVDEDGCIFEVHDYLESLMGESHWECATHFYEPHINGPVTNAPLIQLTGLVFCPCGCTKEVKPGTDCTGEPVAATA